ncbi:hypothetical protein QUV80_14930, partial [Paraclostridium benzoelyticum]|nr:hypothetical protein [Paraclostridium benzoelyticum]
TLKEDIHKLTSVIDEQARSVIDQLELVFKYIDIYKEALDMSNSISLESAVKNNEVYDNPNQTFDLDELDEIELYDDDEEEELEYDK